MDCAWQIWGFNGGESPLDFPRFSFCFGIGDKSLKTEN